MILLMMEEIKAVAVLTPGVPSVSKIVSVQLYWSLFHYFFKILVQHGTYGTSEGQVLPT